MKFRLFLRERIHRRLWVQMALVVVLLAIALPLRFWRLSEVPIDFYFDEGAHGFDALGVLNGDHRPFFATNNGREGMIVYTTAAMIPLLGKSILAVRLPVAMAGVATVLAIFWLGQVLFHSWQENSVGMPRRWKGLFIGALAAGLYAVSLGQTILGRTGYRANFLVLLLPLSVGLLWSGLERRSHWRLIVAGMLTGLLPYTYISARIVPLLLILIGLSFLGAPWREAWLRIRSYFPLLVLYLGVALFIATPILIYFVRHPADFLIRVEDVSLIGQESGGRATVDALLRNLGLHLAAFGFVGDPRLLANLDSRPILNPVETIFFWTGLGVAIIGWRRAAYRLLVIWLGIMLLPAILSIDWDYPPPNTLRMSSALPAAYLLIGISIWHSGQFLMVRLRRFKATQFFEQSVIAGVVVLGMGMVTTQGIITFQSYFEQWVATMYTELYPSWLDLVKQINGEPPGNSPVYVIPRSEADLFPVQYNFDFLYQGTVPAYVFQTMDADFPKQLQRSLADQGTVSVQANAVDWAREWRADPTGRIPFLLGKYGQSIAEETYTDYTVTSYSNLQLDRAWELYQWLDPMGIQYDGGISLHSAAIGLHGGGQVPLAEVVPYESVIWLVLNWQANQSLNVDYQVSLRLYDEEGNQHYQRDWGLWDAMYRPSSSWLAQQTTESLHLLTLPNDLPPGLYELRVVVYDQESLTPTVEIGSWQAEKTLARLAVH